jgi:integrase
MKGAIISHKPKQGKKTFGYSLFLGRDENGKQLRQVKRGFQRECDAEAALRQAIEEQERTPATERTMPTFAEFFERWHTEVVLRQHSPKTSERSHELAQYAIRLFDGVALDQLTTEQLAKDTNRLLDHGGRVTKQHKKGRPLAPNTVRHIAFGVQACLEQALNWEYITKNPMRKVKKPKVPKRRPKVVDSRGFDALLHKSAGLSVYPVIVLGMATGMRRGELLALEWTDLDWERALLQVSKSLEETKAGLRIKSTKNGETRRFAIPEEVLEVLREHKQEQDRHHELYGPDYANLNLIFARPDGSHYSPDKVGTRVRAAMRRAGLAGVSLHSLRHSHASELLSNGARLPRFRNGSAMPVRISRSPFTATPCRPTIRPRRSCGTMPWGSAAEQPQAGARRRVITGYHRGRRKTSNSHQVKELVWSGRRGPRTRDVQLGNPCVCWI